MHVVGIDHDEDHAHERCEDDVHERTDEFFGIGANFLELAERLAAALILEDLEGDGQGMANAVGVELGAEPLGDDVDEVVLEVFRDAGDERDADRHT